MEAEAVLHNAFQRIEDLERRLLLQQHQQQQEQHQPPRSNFRARKPSTFSGNRWDANVLESWIQEVDMYFFLTQIPEDQQAVAAASFLVGHAALWWRMRVREDGLADAGTWPELQAELRRNFMPARAEAEARDKLAKLKQRGRLTSYVLKFREVISQIPTMSDDEKLHRFLEGLNDLGMRKELDYRQPGDWQAAIELALRYDSIHNGDRNNRSFPNAPDTRRPLQGSDPMDIGAMTNNPQPRKCFRCGEPGHMVRNCPQRRGDLN